MKKLWMILLVLTMCFSVVACGAKEVSYAGRYEAVSAELQGLPLSIEGIYGDSENYLELADNGEGVLCLDDVQSPVAWILEDGAITVTVEGKDCVGFWENGVLTIDMMGTGLLMSFENAEYAQ